MGKFLAITTKTAIVMVQRDVYAEPRSIQAMDEFQETVYILGGAVLASFVAIAFSTTIRDCLRCCGLIENNNDAWRTWKRVSDYPGLRLCFGIWMIAAAASFLLMIFLERLRDPLILWYLGLELAWSIVTLAGIIFNVGNGFWGKLLEFVLLFFAAGVMVAVGVRNPSPYPWIVAAQAIVFDAGIWSHLRFQA